MSTQKQKLAQMVLQKMKQKKEAQQRNRPHYELLQLNNQFAFEQNQSLKQQVDSLTQQIINEKSILDQLNQNLQKLQSTAKKAYPVIIIKPDFIASENIASTIKEFYRKTSNTFMKTDIIKNQKYQVYLEKQQSIIAKNDEINKLQQDQANLSIKNIKKMQQKRYKVLKQDVKRRLLIEEQNKINNEIDKLKLNNHLLLKQYDLKKENLQNRVTHSQNLQIKIKQEKQKIENKFNQVSYRQYLKQVFNVRIKNQILQKNLVEVLNSLNQAKKISQAYKDGLYRKFAITFIGKSSDSPSKIQGKVQKNLNKQISTRAQTAPKNLTEMINDRSTKQTSVSKFKIMKTQYQAEFDQENQSKLKKKQGLNTKRNYSSVRNLKSQLKSDLKTQRTLSTTLRFSSIKKRFSELESY